MIIFHAKCQEKLYGFQLCTRAELKIKSFQDAAKNIYFLQKKKCVFIELFPILLTKITIL